MLARAKKTAYTASVAAIILLISSCGRYIDLAKTELAPGESSTASSRDESICLSLDPGGDVIPFEPIVEYGVSHNHSELKLSDLPDVDTVTPLDDGTWEAPFTAPVTPGPYGLLTKCNFSNDIYWEYFRVQQPELDLNVSPESIEVGDTVSVSATWCQAENNYGFDDLVAEKPVMRFLLDGEEVEEIEAVETNPTGAASTEITLDETGEYEITAVCTYNGVNVDVDELGDRPDAQEIEAVTSAFDGEVTQSATVIVKEAALPEDEPGESDPENGETGDDETKNDPVDDDEAGLGASDDTGDELKADASKKQPSFTG